MIWKVEGVTQEQAEAFLHALAREGQRPLWPNLSELARRPPDGSSLLVRTRVEKGKGPQFHLALSAAYIRFEIGDEWGELADGPGPFGTQTNLDDGPLLASLYSHLAPQHQLAAVERLAAASPVPQPDKPSATRTATGQNEPSSNDATFVH